MKNVVWTHQRAVAAKQSVLPTYMGSRNTLKGNLEIEALAEIQCTYLQGEDIGRAINDTNKTHTNPSTL